MPIPFVCDCGKKMTAKEEFAGRRLRCPECQRVVTIPKVDSSVIPVPAKPKAAAPPKTLTRSELAAILRSTGETPPPPPQTVPAGEPNFGELFGGSPTAPVARPAAPAARLVAAPLAGAVPAVHPWVDDSLAQTATPWRPGDEERFQSGIAPAREWALPLGWIVPAIVLAGAIALTLYA